MRLPSLKNLLRLTARRAASGAVSNVVSLPPLGISAERSTRNRNELGRDPLQTAERAAGLQETRRVWDRNDQIVQKGPLHAHEELEDKNVSGSIQVGNNDNRDASGLLAAALISALVILGMIVAALLTMLFVGLEGESQPPPQTAQQIQVEPGPNPNEQIVTTPEGVKFLIRVTPDGQTPVEIDSKE